MVDALGEGIDVLYLVCHGALTDDVRDCTGEAGQEGRPGRRAQARGTAVGAQRRPTVVLLCSQSAGAETEARTGDEGELAALGPRLAAAGMAAVVAMQGNVSMTTAATFAEDFFRPWPSTAWSTWPWRRRDALFAMRTTVGTGPLLEAPFRADVLPAGVHRARRLHLAVVGATARRGELHTGARTRAGRLDLGSRQEIACRWVKRWQMPIATHNQTDLAQVAQFLRVRGAPGIVRAQMQAYLRNEISEQRCRAAADDPVWHDFPEDLLGDPKKAILEIGKRLRANDEGDPIA